MDIWAGALLGIFSSLVSYIPILKFFSKKTYQKSIIENLKLKPSFWNQVKRRVKNWIISISLKFNRMKNTSSSCTLAVFFFIFLFSNSLKAQAPNPPTPIEFQFGHERLDFQLVFKKNFTPQKQV